MDIIEDINGWRLTYNQWAFDYKYKVYKKNEELYTLVSFQSVTEAYNYFNKIVK